MGLLSTLFRRDRRIVVVERWRPDGLGVIEYTDGEYPDEGDKYSNSYRVAYWNPALPGRRITVSYYAVQYEAWGNDEWGIEQCVEWSISDPPDDDPWFESTQTTLVNAVAIDSPVEAEEDAAGLAAEDDSDAGAELYGTWDGEPFKDGD